MMKKMMNRILTVVALLILTCVIPVSAAYEPTLPSLYETFYDDFMFGTFSSMGNYYATGDTGSMMQKHYNSWSPANDFKPDTIFGNGSNARTAYNAVLPENYATNEEYLAAKDKANRTPTLANVSNSIATFLNNVRATNATRGDKNQIKVKAHVLVWHNMTNAAFFRNGFATSGTDWASKEVMLDRLDSYIKQVFTRYATYNDIIYSWDVANECIDDYTGQIRNENDYQPSNWGRIFKAPATMTGDEKLMYESEYIRKAFESARKYSNELGLDWTLVYNDFFDADKPYEPKQSATVKMLEPIYAAGNVDVYGFQGRNATALDLKVFTDAFAAYSKVCDVIQFTEADTRCDLEINPDYDPNDIHAKYYLDDGVTKNPDWNRTDIHSTVLRVIPGWTAAMANQPEHQIKQADWLADYFDFLLENSKGNGGKIELFAPDGTNDGSTFNSNKGCHMFMSADSAGNTINTAKMSFYSVIGSKARFEIKKKLSSAPDTSSQALYTADSWDTYATALNNANNVLNTRIYNMDDVNNANNALTALSTSLDELADLTTSLKSITVDGISLNEFSSGKRDYDVLIPMGSLPIVAATAIDATSNVEISQTTVPGKATIIVTSNEGAKQNTYTINFTVDTTLKSLMLNGSPMSEFSPSNYTYSLLVPFGSVNQVTAIANDPNAIVTITQVAELPGQAKVNITAGTAQTDYTINFTVDTSLSTLKVNGTPLSGFSSSVYEYNALLPIGMKTIPQVTATSNDPGALVVITQATAIPGNATVAVGSGSSQKVYTVRLTFDSSGNDEFNDSTLNMSRWNWVREDNTKWSLTTSPGALTITPTIGDLYTTSNNQKNLLLQDAPGDWVIETKFTASSRPNSSYQQGAIIAYQDDDNFIKLDWEATSATNTVIQVLREIGGVATGTSVNGSVVSSATNTIWFRLMKSGNNYTGYYSVDGTTFTMLGTTYTLNLNNVKTGILACNGGSGTATGLDIHFDYFHNGVVGILLPADKAALASAINAAQALEASDYSTATWLNVQTSLTVAIAKIEDINATQMDVNAAQDSLQTAINGLENKIANEVTLTGSGSVRPGETFIIGISLSDLTNSVYAQDITLSYDIEAFEYVDATGTNGDIQILKSDSSVPGTLRLVAVNIGGITGASTPVIDVSFKVKTGVEDVSKTIAVTKAKFGAMPDGIVVQGELTSKVITVSSVEIDKAALIAAIAAANIQIGNAVVGEAPGQYPAAAKTAFQAAINAAIEVNINTSATQLDVENAVSALSTAKTIFEASVISDPIPSVDKSLLSAAITLVQSLYDNAVVGSENGQYWAANKAALNAAIVAANAVYTNPNATQTEVDNAAAALNTAKAAFEGSMIKATTGDINNDSSVNIGDLAVVAYYYNMNSNSSNWATAKIADINNDGVIDIADLAFIAQRILE